MGDNPSTPAPKRRWWQFSLRTALLATTAVAILSPLGIHAICARRRGHEQSLAKALVEVCPAMKMPPDSAIWRRR
jgi:hypothetical protein